MYSAGCRVSGEGCRVQGEGCMLAGVGVGAKTDEPLRKVARHPLHLPHAPDEEGTFRLPENLRILVCLVLYDSG